MVGTVVEWFGFPVLDLLVACGLAMAVIGALWLRRILTVEDEISTFRSMAPQPRARLATAALVIVGVLFAVGAFLLVRSAGTR